MIHQLEDPHLNQILDQTTIDRRYDDKINLLITSLVNGLENRNRELIQVLEQVNDLNQKVVETERFAAIGQLCSVIAHEIRNPLGLIDLYAKLVEDQFAKMIDINAISMESDKQEILLKNLSQIRQATVSLGTILNELTDYSRPLQIQKESTNLVKLVQDVCDFYMPSYEEKSVHLILPEPDNTASYEVEVDCGRIRQALINLLKNALEVSPPNSTVKVSVASRRSDRYLYIKVSDQGPGVDPKVVGKLFTPYFSTKGNGTGLGLAHSRKVLQAHGGNVELLSSSKDGATFALILPKSP
jgi:signal transduction histidine kinase